MTKITKPATVKRRTTAPKAEPAGIQGRKPGQVEYLRGVLFGPPKTGKTTLACSGRNVLLISFDPDGDATETLIGRDDITVVTPRTRAEIDGIIKALRSTDAGRFDWVVVDSLTFLFYMMGGKDISATIEAGKDPRRDYLRVGGSVQRIIHDLVNLDANVIFTAHLAKVSDEETVSVEQDLGEREVKVAVTPMVWSILGAAVSFIGRTYRETSVEKVGKTRNWKTRYAVSFNDGERSPAGSRLSMEGEYEITNSTLKDLADTLIGG